MNTKKNTQTEIRCKEMQESGEEENKNNKKKNTKLWNTGAH